MNKIEIIEKGLAILLSVLIFFNGYYIKKKMGSWLFPSSILSFFWFIYTFIPLVVLIQVPINIYSQLFITVSILLFSWTHVFFNWKKEDILNNVKKHPSFLCKTKFIKSVLVISVITSVAFILIHISYQEINLFEYFKKPIETAENFSKKRYALELINTPFNQISLILSYLASILSGLIFLNSQKTRSKLKLLFCFLPSLLILITQSAKGTFFLSVFLFLGGVYASLHYIKLQINQIKISYSLLISVIATPFLLFYSFLSRGFSSLTTSIEVFNRMKYLFSSYILAHLYTFSDWFNAYINRTSSFYEIKNNYYGYYTFNFITKYIDPQNEYIRGIYREYYGIPNVFYSNVYTVFRGLIMDFGVIGAFIFIFIFGLFTHKVYHLFLINKNPISSTVIMIFIFSSFYMSFLASILYWSVIPISFLLLYLTLKINKKYVV